jgi:hypothetical protein
MAAVRRSEVAYNLVAGIVNTGLVVVASFVPLSTLRHTLSIQCVY